MSLEKNENKNLEHLDKEDLKLESELETDDKETRLAGDDEGQLSPKEKEDLERRKMNAFLTFTFTFLLELMVLFFLNRRGLIPHTLFAFIMTVVAFFVIGTIVIKVLEKYFKL